MSGDERKAGRPEPDDRPARGAEATKGAPAYANRAVTQARGEVPGYVKK